MAQARMTIDHDEIRKWVESRGGRPARVKRTGRGARRGASADTGILRIDFPGFAASRTLERISWDEWLDAFEKNKLAFLYQDRVAGGKESRFSKLVARPAQARGGRLAVVSRRRATLGRTRATPKTAAPRRGAPAERREPKMAASSEARNAPARPARAPKRRAGVRKSTAPSPGRVSRSPAQARAARGKAARGGAARGATARGAAPAPRGGATRGRAARAGRRSSARDTMRA